jgi:CheY-like chemotaxis protein
MPGLSGQSILIVDDERFVVDMLKLKLEKLGSSVIPAYDASTAFDLACEHHPRLIITDYDMPGQTGYELLENLKANPATKDIPVILLTARGHSISPEFIPQFDKLFPKPFSFNELLRAMELLIMMTHSGDGERREHKREHTVTSDVFIEFRGGAIRPWK